MNEIMILLVATILNGISMLIGTYIGLKMGAKATGEEFEKRAMRVIDTSPTARAMKKMVMKADEMLESQNLVVEATRFFKEAREAISSPEVKTLIKNVTDLVKDFSEPQKVSLKMPKKKKGSKSL